MVTFYAIFTTDSTRMCFTSRPWPRDVQLHSPCPRIWEMTLCLPRRLLLGLYERASCVCEAGGGAIYGSPASIGQCSMLTAFWPHQQCNQSLWLAWQLSTPRVSTCIVSACKRPGRAVLRNDSLAGLQAVLQAVHLYVHKASVPVVMEHSLRQRAPMWAVSTHECRGSTLFLSLAIWSALSDKNAMLRAQQASFLGAAALAVSSTVC